MASLHINIKEGGFKMSNGKYGNSESTMKKKSNVLISSTHITVWREKVKTQQASDKNVS